MRNANPFDATVDQLPPAFAIEKTPFLTIGADSLGGVASLDSRNPWLTTVTLSNGTIVAKDLTRLIYFTKDGQFLALSGQKGKGPGEFSQTREICSLGGEGILAIDMDERVSTWDSNGHLIRSFGRLGNIPNGGCSDDSEVVLRMPGVKVAQLDTMDNLMPHRLLALSGNTFADIGFLPGMAVGTIPWVISRTNGIVFADGRHFDVRLYDKSGKLRRITRLLGDREPITDQEWRVRVERNNRGHNGEPLAPGALRRFRNPGRDPAFSYVRVDPQQRIWVSEFRSEQRWTVFDSSGVLMGRVEFPGDPSSDTGLAGFGLDYLVLRSRDQQGDLRLQLYKLASGPR